MERINRSQKARRITAVVLITACLLVLTTAQAISQSPGSLRVSFINVGQGDAALLHDSDGFDVLIDGGLAAAGPTVVSYLRAEGVDDIDVLVASHADADHIGGLIAVLGMADIPVEAVVYNGYPGDTTTWSTFINAVSAEGLTPTEAQFPQTFQWGSMTAHVLNPAAVTRDPETNDASLVLRVDFGEFNLLFTGDIDTRIEEQVLARGTPVGAEIIKVAHHGSAYGSSDAFLSAVGPLDSVISVGNNSYGHPDAGTIRRILDSGSKMWRTDRNGSVTIVSDGISYTLSSEFIQRLLHLPLLLKQTPAPTGTPPTVTPVPDTGNIQIVSIFYDGTVSAAEPDEYVEIKNLDDHAVQLQNWTLRDNANTVYTFPAFVIQPNQTCRVYTNQAQSESCGFNYSRSSAVWNNAGDCAVLRNSVGSEVSKQCY